MTTIHDYNSSDTTITNMVNPLTSDIKSGDYVKHLNIPLADKIMDYYYFLHLSKFNTISSMHQQIKYISNVGKT